MTIVISPKELARFIERLVQDADEIENTLNRADAKLGDGDTGTMLMRMIRTFANLSVGEAPDMNRALADMAQAAMRSTGSSLGTLIATGLLAAAKRSGNRLDLNPEELQALLRAAMEAMLTRGGAELGDKTIIDGIASVEAALSHEDNGDPRQRAVAASEEAMLVFRNRPCRAGRAKRYGEKSVGADDPGMLAIHLLLKRLYQP